MSIIILQLILLFLCVLLHTMVAIHDINEISSNKNDVYPAKSFLQSSILVEFTDFAIYSYQFTSSSTSSSSLEEEDNAKDQDSSRRNMLTSTYSLEFSSDATSSSLSYLRRE